MDGKPPRNPRPSRALTRFIVVIAVATAATIICGSVFDNLSIGIIWGISFGMMAYALWAIPPKRDED